jgi:hypothetical protein
LREEGKLALSPWLPSRCLAKSFVLRRGSNFIFPAPISCLGDGYLPDAGESRERDEMSSLSGDWEVADRGPLIPLKPKGGLNGAPSIGCRCGKKVVKPCPWFGVLVRTVLQFGFTVQSSGKKRCGRRVGKLRKWVSACNEPTGSPACEPLSLCDVCFDAETACEDANL